MKYLKIGRQGLAALVIIALAAILRLVLIGQNWPLTNSDEATMGIMALHIAYNGAHPIYFYGQSYMGVIEAYIGAGLFHIFGPSLFTLRLGLVLMYVVFLSSMYLLTSLLYSKGQALLTILLLGLGSAYMLASELMVYGGYPDTLCYGALLSLLAVWIARSYRRQLPRRRMMARLLAYAGWGLVAGLGLWSDLLIAPFILMSGLLMLIVCWREWLRLLAPLGVLAGLMTGILPILLYSLRGSQSGSTLDTIIGLINGGSSHMTHTTTILMQELQGTIAASIPMMTGEPVCPVAELPFMGILTTKSTTCTAIHWSWGIAYLLLLLIAFITVCITIWRALKVYRTRSEKGVYGEAEQQELVRAVGRLTLLISSLCALFIYAYSNAPTGWPGYHAHYLIGLLIITPVIIAPFWSALTSYLRKGKDRQTGMKRNNIVSVGGGIVLGLMVIFYVIGVGVTFAQIPTINKIYQTQLQLTQDLEHLGIKHVYTAYWTCDLQAFISDEHIICGVETDDRLNPTHNRYMPYYTIVLHDPNSAYAFPINNPSHIPLSQIHNLAVEKKLKKFHRYFMDGYIVYTPA